MIRLINIKPQGTSMTSKSATIKQNMFNHVNRKISCVMYHQRWLMVGMTLLLSLAVEANPCKDAFQSGDLDLAFSVCKETADTSDPTSSAYQWSKLILFDVAHYKQNEENAYRELLTLSQMNLTDDMRYELHRRQGSYYRIKKQYSYAKSYYQKALQTAELLASKVKMAKSYNDMGLIYLKEKDYKKSLDFLKKSLKIKYELGNQLLIQSTLTNLGLLYYKTDDFQEAITHYKKVEELLLSHQANSSMTQRELTHLYSYYAAAYNKWGKLNLSEAYISKFNQRIITSSQGQEKMSRYLNLLEILIDNGDFDFAEKVISQVDLEMAYSDHNNAQFYYYKALLAYHFERYEESKHFVNKGMSQIKLHKDTLFQEQLYLLFSKIELKLGHYRAAYEWYEKFHMVYVKDLQNQIDQDFNLLKYEQTLENKQIDLIKEQLNNAVLSKRNYQYLVLLFVLVGALLIFIMAIYYRSKVLAQDNLLLNKDIEKHKEICDILEKQPVSFKNLLKDKPFPIVVMNNQFEWLYGNFTMSEEETTWFIELLKSHKEVPAFKPNFHAADKVPMMFDLSKFDALKQYTHINVQNVFSAKYFILSFCHFDTDINLSKEINAIAQFEFYLEQHQAIDHLQTQKLTVDCMNLCLNVWTKTTSNNRIEFADQSKAWKINVDDGRLRTRSLDRYLSIKTIPKNPRLMQVIKSCQFMLSLDQINNQDRVRINFYLEKIQSLC